jgi:cytochrome c556
MRSPKPLIAIFLGLGLTGAALAHGGHAGHAGNSASKAIDYRTSVMQIFKWNMGFMSAMAKGEIPYDHAAFARHAGDLAAATRLDLLGGFPEGSDDGDTDALPEIWLDWKAFTAKYQDLQHAASELEQAAAGADQTLAKTKLGTLGKACKSCHDKFRD